jgi:hypothetical protein
MKYPECNKNLSERHTNAMVFFYLKGWGVFHTNLTESGMNDHGLLAKTAHCLSALGIVAKEQGSPGCYEYQIRLNSK